MAESPGLDRLSDAMAAWMEFRRSPTTPRAEFLARHDSLRDLLEPMLDDEPADAAAVTKSTTEFGDFRLLREIGRGGMGVVHEAVQLSLGRRVALKLLLDGSLADARALARFRREAAVTAQFAHQNIVAVHAVGEHEGRPWFAMELVDGMPLDAYARALRARDPSGWIRVAIELVAKVADALHAAHLAGVVHRDVKPSNILIREDGVPVVTDFGLARSAGVPSLSQTGDFAGTPNYVSPEQARGASEVDRRSDVFSLGVTLYELLTRELPFRGNSSREVLDRIQRFEPRAPSRVDSELPRDLDAVVLTALAKDPRQRYQDAAALAADLRRFLSHRPVLARRPGLGHRCVMWARREPLRAALIVALAVVIGMAGTLIGNEDALRRGSAALAAEQVEDLLLRATIAPMIGMTAEEKQSLLDSAAALGRDDAGTTVILALAFANSRKREQDGLALIDSHVARHGWTSALRRARQEIAHRIDPNAPAIELPAPTEAMDHYVCGALAMRAWTRGEPNAGRMALDHLGHAVALTERPRAMFFIVLNQAARANEDVTAMHLSGDALAHHWPNSPVSHLHRAMAWMGEDLALARASAERSLELAPNNFLGLLLMSEIADLDGEHAESARWLDEARTRYPKLEAFLHQSGHGEGESEGQNSPPREK